MSRRGAGRAAASPLDAPTLPALLVARAAATPDAVALRQKHRGLWEETTWRGYADRVARVTGALEGLGVGPGDRVAILSGSRIEWPLADLATQGLGAWTVGLSPALAPAEIEPLLARSGASVLVAEDEEQLDKALLIRERLPALRHVVLVDPRNVTADDAAVTTWTALEDGGGAGTPYAERAAGLDEASPATVVFSPATADGPRGALVAHRDLRDAATALAATSSAGPRDELLSYLPPSYLPERLLSIAVPLRTGCVVNFGEGGDAFAQDVREVQPTVFLGLPAVWEELHGSVRTRTDDASWLKRRVHRMLGPRDAPDGGSREAAAGRRGGILGELVLHRPLRDRLGLRRVRHATTGGEPLRPEVAGAFQAIGVPIADAGDWPRVGDAGELDADGRPRITARPEEATS